MMPNMELEKVEEQPPAELEFSVGEPAACPSEHWPSGRG